MITALVLFSVTTGSLLLLSLLFLSNVTRVNVRANHWLGAFYFCLACLFCQLLIETAGLSQQVPRFIQLLELSRWATLPCFYLAIVYFVNPVKRSYLIFLHFAPAAIFMIYSLIFINPGFSGGSQPALPQFMLDLIRYFFRIQAVIYWILSFRLLRIHSRNIKNISSSIENINLSWIKYLLIALLVMLLVRIASSASELVSSLAPWLYFFGVFLAGYFSLRQEVIYPVKTSSSDTLKFLLNERKVYERLTIDQVNELKDKVDEIMRSKRLYLDPSLTLPSLSAETGINTHELSYILNTGLNQNFYSYINEMRVEEAKRILLSPKAKQLDMVGIAFHAGFNSKTTFNTTFKKATGMTPSEFMKQGN